MRSIHYFKRIACLLVTFAPGLLLPVSAEADDAKFVIVELFTSQGCSSCPPADRLLTQLGNEGVKRGTRVLPLSFHVDYWNYIGWTDPFSSPEWSQRQRRYARTFGLDTVYTPQLVIHGVSQVVGSNEAKVRSEIARAARLQDSVVLDLSVEGLDDDSGQLEVAIEARPREEAPANPYDVLVAVLEEELETPVRRGENASRTLRNDFVVRSMQSVLTQVQAQSDATASADFTIAPEWKKERLAVIVFAQDTTTLRILGAVVARP